MKKKGKAEAVISLILVFTTTATGWVLSKIFDPTKQNNNKENKVGYSNVSYPLNAKVKENDVVVLNVGDNDSLGVIFQNAKMKYCNDNDIALGIVIDSSAEKLNEIYDDVNYAKSIVTQYKINMPIYLNIDKIVNNKSLSSADMILLIKTFLEKCSLNGMFVGMTGLDSNLHKLELISKNNNFDIDSYDALLVREGKGIQYNGNYSMIKQADGTIENCNPNCNINAIEKNRLNMSSSLYGDVEYEIKTEEDIENILTLAVSKVMSYEELLEYNNKRELKIGDIISIPTELDRSKVGYKPLVTPIKGIDMSYCNKKCDYDKIPEDCKFVIIRSNQGLYKDKLFDQHYDNISKKGISIGVFCFNDYYDKDLKNTTVAEFKNLINNQSNKTLEIIKGKDIDCPVFFDIDSDYFRKNVKYVGEKLMVALNDWKSKMEENGYTPGLYFNASTYEQVKKLAAKNGMDIDRSFVIWVANGIYYDTKINYDALDETAVPKKIDADIYQVTQYGLETGVTTGGGFCDINMSYLDLSKKQAYVADKTKYADMEFDRDRKYIAGNAAAAILGAAGLGTAPLIKLKKRVKKRKGGK